MAWNRNPDTDSEPATPRQTASGSPGSPGNTAGRPSTLGPSISIKGTLKGAEDLRVEGSVEGTIRFDQQNVVVSESGRIKADIFGRKICVEGEVKGNLFGEREIIIRPSGKLEGNITAPSVTLENGAKFRGSIDMEPTAEKGAKEAPTSPSKPATKSRTPAHSGAPTPAAASSS